MRLYGTSFKNLFNEPSGHVMTVKPLLMRSAYVLRAIDGASKMQPLLFLRYLIEPSE